MDLNDSGHSNQISPTPVANKDGGSNTTSLVAQWERGNSIATDSTRYRASSVGDEDGSMVQLWRAYLPDHHMTIMTSIYP